MVSLLVQTTMKNWTFPIPGKNLSSLLNFVFYTLTVASESSHSPWNLETLSGHRHYLFVWVSLRVDDYSPPFPHKHTGTGVPMPTVSKEWLIKSSGDFDPQVTEFFIRKLLLIGVYLTSTVDDFLEKNRVFRTWHNDGRTKFGTQKNVPSPL